MTARPIVQLPSSEQLEQYREQELKDAKNWHQTNIPHISQTRLADYEAGFNEGWRKAVAAVRLQSK